MTDILTCPHGETGPHRIELTDTPLGILVIDCDGPDTAGTRDD